MLLLLLLLPNNTACQEIILMKGMHARTITVPLCSKYSRDIAAYWSKIATPLYLSPPGLIRQTYAKHNDAW